MTSPRDVEIFARCARHARVRLELPPASHATHSNVASEHLALVWCFVVALNRLRATCRVAPGYQLAAAVWVPTCRCCRVWVDRHNLDKDAIARAQMVIKVSACAAHAKSTSWLGLKCHHLLVSQTSKYACSHITLP